ncbi:MAG TPA: hypothetical protein VG965_03515 [Patescibacteria group bacterium]|nr:hypothetical protein [Patescibacteria group bacterium]
MKKILGTVMGLVIVLTAFVAVAKAASPDGLGPWADSVVATTQGLRNDGSAVPAIRSDATSALGVAENDTVEGHFYSLGFGGTITLGFVNGISSGAFVVEATNNPYPNETALVEVSQDGTHWYTAGTVSQDGTVPLPSQVACGKYVRITDTSNKADFTNLVADGYDVDGVQAQGLSCSTTGRMTGGGSVFTADKTRVTHGFTLYCDSAKGSSNLEINWGKGNNFHLTSLASASCTDDPLINQGHPAASFDTYKGTGSGTLNGVAGYTATWTFVDAGEPGKNDTAAIVIKDSSNAAVLTVSGNLNNGNQQAHD